MGQSFAQTSLWAKFKEQSGWQAFEVENIWVLEKKLPFGKSFLYSPEVNFGEIHPEQSRGIEYFLENTKKIAQKNNSIFFRLEILDEFSDEITQNLKENGFIKSFEDIQPEWRQVVDISKNEEEILAQMKQKGRYNIRVAERHGVSVEKSEKIDEFYQIFRQTAQRDGFEIRPQKYFEDLLTILVPAGIAELWIARYNGKTIAAILATFYEGVASYLYGASSNEFREVMAPYLLHWRVIQRAKERGCCSYDLLAVTPQEAVSHKYAGITRFKEQFGGRKVHLVGSYDLVYKPTWYWMFKIAEKYRRK